MTLANAFTTAWKDLKSVALKVTAFIAKQQPEAQKIEGEAVSIAAVVAPAAVPVITQMDSLEEAVVGAVAAAAQDTAKESTLAELLGDLWEPFKAVAATLKSHPTVTSVTAALNSVAPKA